MASSRASDMSCALALRVKLRLETRATRAAWATLADFAPATARAPLMARAFMVVVMMGGGSLVCSSRWFDRGRFSSLCIVCPPPQEELEHARSEIGSSRGQFQAAEVNLR